MSGGEEGLEKSFEPSQNRLDQARRDGDAPHARDATEAAVYLGGWISIVAVTGVAATGLATSLALLMERSTSFAGAAAHDVGPLLQGAMVVGAIAAAPILLAPAVLAAASLAAQRAIVFAPKKLTPKWSRLSPAENAKKKFGPDGLFEFAKSALKLALVCAIFGWLAIGSFPRIALLSGAAPQALAPAIQAEAALFIGALTILAVAIGAVDLVHARMQHRKKLMMTLEEVRREAKESEGDPHMKHSRRERSRAIATNRMLTDVARASVVIVNPTHYAVALRWDGPKTGAPVCVAKGVDEMAARIRTLAAASGVPIRRDPPTARALHAVVDVGEEVRREHFAAVAAAIQYAEQMRRDARSAHGAP